ncbi:WXG100 family type VII secretion target [Actinacidiphila yanglinensis]|uniref:WXG100 family type VII secretion target n=1 Tax=Actinacidiphila yanglinensis TaxID=310779 RepID=A0A1H5Y3Q7_9ACTN|nr:WXG100 family type VII secretion target [Actinacidiphila yanglinensis]SEG18699.1 WXG100 family type VII secretion target [Actinacidiphila yanglinensis]
MVATDGGGSGFTGSDGVLYHTTPHDLKEKAVDISNTQQVVQGQLDTLKSYVQDLESVWGGIAASTFQNLMGDWDTCAARMQNALLGISDGLSNTADNYVQGEQTNVTNFSRVVLPPARLS